MPHWPVIFPTISLLLTLLTCTSILLFTMANSTLIIPSCFQVVNLVLLTLQSSPPPTFGGEGLCKRSLKDTGMFSFPPSPLGNSSRQLWILMRGELCPIANQEIEETPRKPDSA